MVWALVVQGEIGDYRRRGGRSGGNIHRRGEGSGARKSHLEGTSPDLT